MDDALRRIWSSRLTRNAGTYAPWAMLTLVFLVDLNTPLGFAVCLGYAPAVLLATLTRNRAVVAAVALLSMALTLAGILLSPPALPGTPGIYIVVHRGLSLAAIATCACISLFMIRLVDRFAAAKEMLDMASSLGKLGAWRVDLNDGRVHWSDEVARIHGQPPGYVPTVDEGIDYYPPEYQDLARQCLAACSEHGTPFAEDMQIITRSGERRWVRGVGRAVRNERQEIVAVQGAFQDIDEHKCLQHEATLLAERLTATMETVGDAILILDGQWRAVFINHHGEALLNVKREDLIGEYIWAKFPEAVGSTFEKEYTRCVEQQVAVRFEEYFEPLQKHFEINAYPAPDGLTIYFRDITQQRLLAEQMIQAQKLESLGRLTGGVAHDFNNLLTVILGNAEMLVEQSAPGATEHMLAEMIFGAAQRGAAMTQRLLAFARKQALEPVPSDLNQLVTNTDQLVRHTLGGHIEIDMVRAAGLWLTLADPGQLESALLNLAINARDAMPDGGRLTIETANATLDEAYAAKHSGVAPGEYVMLAVSDSGTGIAPELLARVFEPFFTTKQMGKGTGLGLAMVYGFVMQSKGHIAIYSELEHGTTVKIYLPRLVNAERTVAPAGAAERVQVGNNQLILLAEDDAMVRDYARGQLEELGYRVIEAASGAGALELLHARDDIDLLFTDVVMPGGMSGRQLADTVQAFRPALPILYTSGYTHDAIIHHGRLEPGVMLLSKPYRRAELAQKVSAALGAAAGASHMETQ